MDVQPMKTTKRTSRYLLMHIHRWLRGLPGYQLIALLGLVISMLLVIMLIPFAYALAQPLIWGALALGSGVLTMGMGRSWLLFWSPAHRAQRSWFLGIALTALTLSFAYFSIACAWVVWHSVQQILFVFSQLYH